MSSPATEEPKKKRKKIIWFILIPLILILLIPLIFIFGYTNKVNQAWDQAESIDIQEIMPNDDGTVNTPHNEELQALADQAQTVVQEISNSENAEKTLEENITAIDSNGDGIPDLLEGGAVTTRPGTEAAATSSGETASNWAAELAAVPNSGVNSSLASLPASDSTNILLLGSDQRSGAEAIHVTGARADTIMVLHIPADGSAAYLISIMRDTWVNIPGYGSAKINAALNYGGIPLQVATIEQLLGVQMDHVAEIDFQGFKAMVDTLGGVTVNVPFTFSSGIYTYNQGSMRLDGGQALQFVRERYSFADGDYQRVRNQRAFLRGIYNELKADGALASAQKLLEVIESVAPYMTVDSGLSPSAIVGIAQPVLANGNTSLVSLTLPNAGTGWSWDGQSIVVLNSIATADLSNALRASSMANYVSIYGSDY